jgi:ATP-dependent Clp protease ATP-binding subunit ClpA
MFERFTDKARRVVVIAQETARDRCDLQIRTEHILLALYRVPDNLALTVLAAHSVAQADIEADVDRLRVAGPSDAEALATLGIDLDEVRRQVEDAFGPGALDRTRAARGRGRWLAGHIPFDPASRKTLELALREAIRLGHDYIGCEHVLLGLLHTETGAAHHILDGRGVRLDSARVIVEELVRRRQAG